MAADPRSIARRKLLVVEDDEGLQKQLRWMLSDYDVIVAGDRAAALAELRRHAPSVVTLDLGLPPDPANASQGLAALEEILVAAPATKVIVVTGNDDKANALAAVARGAYDFYQKPIDPDVLPIIIHRAFGLYALEEENRRLARAAIGTQLSGIIASSPSMLQLCRTVEKIARIDTTVLLLGESGTGKELIARALHERSLRAGGRFVAINCAAIPENLLESELFGYEKGAFTGAGKQTRGKFEYADGGTLLLDEVGDLPSSLQAKLLRFLQQRVIERVGGREEIPVDTRVVCATHKDLKTLIQNGTFREDLYYRIAEITLRLPPLRERPGDALLIARAIISEYASKTGLPVKALSDRSAQAIENYAWPGNVRELENKVKRGLVMADGKLIEPADLELDEGSEARILTLRDARDRAESEVLKQALARSGGQIAKAAEILGISRPTLYHLMRKYAIEV